MRISVIGAGVAGLGAALALARDGHDVVLLERDATPLPPDPHAAFEWDRRGAPQVRHSHALLARLRNLLRDHYPDVLADLLAAGATELRFTDNLPVGMEDRSPHPGDDDLVALACRRTTFEWVLRRSVLAQGGVELRDGVVVEGLAGRAGAVSGVRLAGGPTIDADVVVAATGRRSPIPAWLAEVGGAEVFEEEEDTGIVYFSRFYRLCDGVEEPVMEGPIGADLGYLKFAVFRGDNGTFSVTLAVANDDTELRKTLLHPEAFDAAAALMEPVAPWVAPGMSEPITGVHIMAKLLNRLRRFVTPDGRPVATGFHAIGDASICTNPLYGRGCSLAMVHADLVAEALRAHPDDPVARSLAFEEATKREIEPWYDAAVQQDRANRLPAETENPMRDLLRDGVLPATRTDPLVLRAFLRAFNLLSPPNSLMADGEVIGRVLAVYQDRENRVPEPPLGPDRAALLGALAA